jgi:hypothetical protein
MADVDDDAPSSLKLVPERGVMKTKLETALIAGAAAALICLPSCKSSDSVKEEAGPGKAPGESAAASEQKPADRTTAPDPLTLSIMRAKLMHAHVLLEAVTLKDFPRIEQNAAALKALSEESDWHVHATLSYRIFSEQFQEVTDAMEKHAQQRDVEAVARDYAQMTAACFDCHGYLRREGLIKDLPGAISQRPTRRRALGG